MNVEEAMNVAATLEANHVDQYRRQQQLQTENFGHPEAPQLALQKLTTEHNGDNDEDVHLLVGYTKHCITAQIVSLAASGQNSGNSQTPVLHMGSVVSRLRQQHELMMAVSEEHNDDADDPVAGDSYEMVGGDEEDDEFIQCLLIVELENLELCSGKLPHQQQQNDFGDDDDEETNVIILHTSVLAIVAGTNQSRLLVSQVFVQKRLESHNEYWTLEWLSPHGGGNTNNPVLLEVLPRDSHSVAELIRRKNKQSKSSSSSTATEADETMVPFQPSGGISSLLCSYDTTVNPQEQKTSYVWITYRDGNVVRMHHAALFPAIWAEGSDNDASVDDLLSQYNHTALMRCQVRIPPGEEQNVTIVPLLKYHPSPLAPVNFASVRDAPNQQQDKEICFEALVFGGGGDSTFPTWCVYTSEDHFWEPQQVQKSDSLVADVTKALVGGVVGALRWAAGGSEDAGGSHSSHGGEGGSNKAMTLPSTPFPSMWKPPVLLFAGYEYQDVPRIVEHCAVDPDGQYAAMADGLGRVILFDLSTKQIVRMWKGLRQASCFWTKVPPLPTDVEGPQVRPRRNKSYLVVHSKQKRTVEVWPTRAGKRLASFQVHRDSAVVTCPDPSHFHREQQENMHPGRQFGVLVLDSSSSGGPATTLKPLDIGGLMQAEKRNNVANRKSSREAMMHVQHLKQILSADKAMFCSKDDVVEAFCRIKSLNDLSACLDLVATAAVLEDELDVKGSAFQKRALEYCSDLLEQEVNETGDTLLTGGAAIMAKKIDFYSRLIKAYDLLQEYESTALGDGKQTNQPMSNFAQEAVGWADVYETKTKRSMDADLRQGDWGKLRFCQFASSCVFPPADEPAGTGMKVFFSESTRTRQEILVFLFRPLLGWFSSGTVNSVFEALGIQDEYSYLLKCFGEWFFTLTRAAIEDRCQPDSAMSRFLQDVVEREFNAGIGSPLAMDALSSLCEGSADLVRSFMLASLAHQVQLRVTNKKEEATLTSADWYALVKQLGLTQEKLESVLRKIRVCLLVTLRLHTKDLAPFPISVKNLEKEKDYSVYKWIAFDELSMMLRHEEIVTLEIACGLSTHSLNPFSADADQPDKVKLLQSSCSALSDNRTRVTNPDDNAALLLFFGAYNHPEMLAAHRSLLLAWDWIRNPRQNLPLRHAITALKSLPKKAESVSLAYAVTLDVWLRMIAPIYRARLFGFSDIPTIREEDFAPLLENRDWLGEFGRVALQILMLLREALPESDEMEPEAPPTSSGTWPPVSSDYILGSLMKKAQRIDSSALETHIVVVCSMLFSDDRGALADCVPALADCFHPASLFGQMGSFPSKDPQQERFLSEAVVSFASNYCGRAIDSFRILGELELLASRWGFDRKWLRTTFLIVMYELGKDNDVDELMVAGAPHILADQMIVAGVNVVCRRLDHFLKQAKSSRGAEARGIMGLLDAELCEWIHQRAESSSSLASYFERDVPIRAIQILTIRLLSLGSSSNADSGIRTRIHALSVLSGTLVKAMEGR